MAEIFSKELISFFSDNPDVIYYEMTQNFFKEYLTKQISSRDINELLKKNIRSITQNLSLKTWFYQEIFPILSRQIDDIKIDHRVRNERVALLWEVFRCDDDKKDEILDIFVKIIKNECINQEGEICTFIYGSYQPEVKKQLGERLLKLGVKEEVMRKFFPKSEK